jgi:hypothetical protein
VACYHHWSLHGFHRLSLSVFSATCHFPVYSRRIVHTLFSRHYEGGLLGGSSIPMALTVGIYHCYELFKAINRDPTLSDTQSNAFLQRRLRGTWLEITRRGFLQPMNISRFRLYETNNFNLRKKFCSPRQVRLAFGAEDMTANHELDCASPTQVR